MTFHIMLQDTNDPLKDMGFIEWTEEGKTPLGTYTLPWYFEEDERVLGFDTPGHTYTESIFAGRDGWEQKIIGRTPVISTKSGMYQIPNIIVAFVEEVKAQ